MDGLHTSSAACRSSLKMSLYNFAFLAPLCAQGFLANDHWSHTHIQRAAMQFDFRFSSSLAIVGFLALVGNSAPFNNEQWKAISLRYAYQFTLGLKDEFNHLKDWRRLGLKKARCIMLEDHLEMRQGQRKG